MSAGNDGESMQRFLAVTEDTSGIQNPDGTAGSHFPAWSNVLPARKGEGRREKTKRKQLFQSE